MLKIDAMMDKFPHFYDKSILTQLYGFLKSFADEFDITVNNYINRADNDIGIMTTDGADLDWRWGAFMGFPRFNGESDDSYRVRLSNIINAMNGGTRESIKYAVALFLGLDNNKKEMDKRIKVVDAWEFPDAVDQSYGNFVVEIILDGDNFPVLYPNGLNADDIGNIIQTVKAAGTFCDLHFVILLVKENLVVKSSTGYIIYTGRYCGTWPERSKQGMIDDLDIVIKTDVQSSIYRMPYTKDISSGIYPQIAKHGMIDSLDIIAETDAANIVYQTPHTGEIDSGVYPQVARHGMIDNVNIIAETDIANMMYQMPHTGEIDSGIYPNISTHGSIEVGSIGTSSAGESSPYSIRMCGTTLGNIL